MFPLNAFSKENEQEVQDSIMDELESVRSSLGIIEDSIRKDLGRELVSIGETTGKLSGKLADSIGTPIITSATTAKNLQTALQSSLGYAVESAQIPANQVLSYGTSPTTSNPYENPDNIPGWQGLPSTPECGVCAEPRYIGTNYYCQPLGTSDCLSQPPPANGGPINGELPSEPGTPLPPSTGPSPPSFPPSVPTPFPPLIPSPPPIPPVIYVPGQSEVPQPVPPTIPPGTKLGPPVETEPVTPPPSWYDEQYGPWPPSVEVPPTPYVPPGEGSQGPKTPLPPPQIPPPTLPGPPGNPPTGPVPPGPVPPSLPPTVPPVPPTVPPAKPPGTQPPSQPCPKVISPFVCQGSGGTNVIDPEGNPIGAQPYDGTNCQNPCIPICGISSTQPSIPSTPPSTGIPPSTPSPPTQPPTQPVPPSTGRPPIDVGGLNKILCEILAYDPKKLPQLKQGSIDLTRFLASLLYGSLTDENAILEQAAKDVGSFNIPTNLWARATIAFIGTLHTIDDLIHSFWTQQSCLSPQMMAATIERIALNFLSVITGDALDHIKVPLTYFANTQCSYKFPSATEAVEAYLRSEIDEYTLQTWVQQNGFCYEPMKKLVDARETRLDPTSLLRLWRRHIIDDNRLGSELKRLGYLKSDSTDWLKDLTTFVPPITDVIRFMVRDVEDTNIVNRFGLDSDFTAKWSGKAKEWGDWQGVDDETAKRYWRAHWEIPSPTQLFEMYHRSRVMDPSDPGYTSLADVKTALEQQDILPFWIPKLLATTYSRLTRVDARRAFNQGVIDKAELRSMYVRLGYTDRDADILTEWSQREKMVAAKKLPVVNLYKWGVLSEVELEKTLTNIGLGSSEVDYVMREIRESIRAPWIKKCVLGLRKRFILGEIDEAELHIQLLNLRLNPDYVASVEQSVKCERESHGKEPSTATLCGWYDLGMLNDADYVQRLRNLGWSEEDSLRILRQCSAKINERRMRAAEQLAKRQAAAVEKQRRENERTAKQIARAQQQQLRAAEIARRAKERRDKLLQRVVQQLSSATGATIDEAGQIVQQTLNELKKDYLLSADAMVQTLIYAVEKPVPSSLEAYHTRAIELAEELEELGTIS